METNTGENGPENSIVISNKELPLHCPLDGQAAWKMHPKVYLPINKLNEATCPYCGTRYTLRIEK